MVFVDIFEPAPTTRTILQNTYMDIELTTLALPIRWPRGLWITPTLPNFLKGLMVTRHVDMKIFARGGFAGVIDCFRALQGTFLKVFVSDPFGKYKHIYCWSIGGTFGCIFETGYSLTVVICDQIQIFFIKSNFRIIHNCFNIKPKLIHDKIAFWHD